MQQFMIEGKIFSKATTLRKPTAPMALAAEGMGRSLPGGRLPSGWPRIDHPKNQATFFPVPARSGSKRQVYLSLLEGRSNIPRVCETEVVFELELRWWIKGERKEGFYTHNTHRIDGNGNYEPGNVKWMTKQEHTMHHNSGQWVVVDGIKDSISFSAKRVGMPHSVLCTWIKKGISAQECVDAWRDRPKHGRIFPYMLVIRKNWSAERVRRKLVELFEELEQVA